MPHASPIISVSGLRGIIGESLTPEIAIRYAAAFAAGLPPGPIVLSRDGRTTGPMLAASLVGGLTALGRDVIDAGIAATPTTGILVRHHSAAGGIQISASHNPPQYNGLKLFSAEGRVIPAVAGQRVIKRYESDSPAWTPTERVGSLIPCDDPLEPHWALLRETVDVGRIRQYHFAVLLDSNHGAGSLLARRLFDELGCRATIVGGEPDGKFAHTPEPTAENLRTILPLVSRAGANAGFCQDPDADRLAVIDETGRYIGEEYTLAICVAHVLRSRPGPIVINCSTSRMSEDLARSYGVPLVRSAVGEANVVDAMLLHGAVLGGEGSGGVIDPRVGLVRDSFVGMALLLDAMAERGMTMSQLADELPRYEIRKTQIPLPRENLSAALDALESHFAEAKPDRLDGLRLDWPDRWLLVRGSNTEPIVRAVVEIRFAAESSRMLSEATAVLSRFS
jgi:phosphomannomutase